MAILSSLSLSLSLDLHVVRQDKINSQFISITIFFILHVDGQSFLDVHARAHDWIGAIEIEE